MKSDCSTPAPPVSSKKEVRAATRTIAYTLSFLNSDLRFSRDDIETIVRAYRVLLRGGHA